MKKTNRVFLILASLLAASISSNAFAAAKPTSDIKDTKLALTDKNLELNEKQNELSLFGYFNQPTAPSGQDATIMIQLGYGKRLGERFVLGGTLSTMKSGSFTSQDIGVGAKYYFKIGKTGDFVPFAQAGINLGTGTGYKRIQIEGGGGASYFVTETTSLDMRALYQMGTMTPDGGSSVSASGIMAMVGVTQRF